MKKRLLSLAAILLLLPLALQAQMEFGVQGGVNFANLTGKDSNGDKVDMFDVTLGFHMGAFVRIPIAPDFYFQPGVFYSMKGAQIAEMATKAASDDNMVWHLSYIEVPMNILFNPQLGSGHLLLGFGPYVAYGIGGKAKYQDYEADIKFDGDVTTGEYTDEEVNMVFKPFDAGANIFVGYELPMGLFVQFETQLGLLNMIPKYDGEDSGDAKLNNTGFGLSAGFRF